MATHCPGRSVIDVSLSSFLCLSVVRAALNEHGISSAVDNRSHSDTAGKKTRVQTQGHEDMGTRGKQADSDEQHRHTQPKRSKACSNHRKNQKVMSLSSRWPGDLPA